MPGLLHEQSSAYSHVELQLAYQERDTVSASYNHALYLTQRAKVMQLGVNISMPPSLATPCPCASSPPEFRRSAKQESVHVHAREG